MEYLVVAFAAFLIQAPGATSLASSEVTAQDGTFVGISTSTGRQFLGVPYAQATIGDLRWAPPQSLPAQPERRLAQKFGDDCVQPVGWNTDPHPGVFDARVPSLARGFAEYHKCLF